MGLKYRNPPIVEAIFEIHFGIAEPISKPVLLQMQDIWAKEYPIQQVINEEQVTFKIKPDGVDTGRESMGSRLVCKTADGNRVVQASGLFMAINQLKPYGGWEESFRDIILARSSEFQSVVGGLPIRRVGLRYVNKIDIPENPIQWEKWFKFRLPVPVDEIGNATVSNFNMRFGAKLDQGRRLAVAIGKLKSDTQNVTPVILDLDIRWEGEPVSHSELGTYMELVHKPHRLAFEGYLTDTLRNLFY